MDIDQLVEWLSTLSLADFKLVSILSVVFMQAIGKGVLDRVRDAVVVLWNTAARRFWPELAKDLKEALAAEWVSKGMWYNIGTFLTAFGLASLAQEPKAALVTALVSLLSATGVYEFLKNIFNLRNISWLKK